VRRKVFLSIVLLVLGVLSITGVSFAAPGDVLYTTTFSEDDFSWDDWDASNPAGLETFWVVEDGTLTFDWDVEDNRADIILVADGYGWTDYRVEMELEVVVGWAGWVYRAETVEDFVLHEFLPSDYDGSGGDPGGLTAWEVLWGGYSQKTPYYTSIGVEVLSGEVAKIIIEVQGDSVRQYIGETLIYESDVFSEAGSFGFRVWTGANGEQLYKVHSLTVTEL
jgi:hypothetical protein